MKLIAIHTEPLRYEVIADSALTLPGRPWFIPECGEAASWQLQPMLAVRISRLGKSISPKFAPRYFDAITVAFRLMPLNSEGMPLVSVASIIDFGIELGQWTAAAEEGAITLNIAGNEIKLENLSEKVSETIAEISKLATLKMGDTLLLPLPLHPLEANEGAKFSATINGVPVMESHLR